MSNPRGGGAERHTENILIEMVKRGYDVTLFASSFQGALTEEDRKGLRIIRRGGRFSVYREARKYLKQYQQDYDLIIDEINTIPFGSYRVKGVKNKLVVWIHQLARNVWFYETPFPFSLAAYIIEPFLLKPYVNVCEVVTVSNSTKNDLVKLGFNKDKIHVIPQTCDYKVVDSLNMVQKNTFLQLLYVGRMKRSKRVHHIIRALYEIRKSEPEARLVIIGSGDESYIRYLKRLIHRLGLTEHVLFTGFVTDEEKSAYMRSSHFILMTSVREGWGLAVNEANAQGTPAVVYNVHGLRDSTIHGKTGWVCEKNTPTELARGVLSLYHDKKNYVQVQKAAWNFSKSLTIERATDAFERVITGE